MTHQKRVIGNLKMYLESASMLEAYLQSATEAYKDLPRTVTTTICPPMPYMESFAKTLKPTSVRLGAQDCFWEMHGRYTGNVSPHMLATVGAEDVILGHSERRALGETNETVARKCRAALRAHLTPIVCVGYVPEGGDEIVAITEQVGAVMAALSEEDAAKVIFAYEPVWAIGSGRTPTPEAIYTVTLLIRKVIAKYFAQRTQDTPILYGGSVTPENVHTLCVQAHTDGVLVGGVSLRPPEFAQIVRALANA